MVPFNDYCYLPPVYVKKLKNQLYPGVHVSPRRVLISGLTWDLTFIWDDVMARWIAYLRGEMGDEDHEILRELMAVEGSEWSAAEQAWESDLARRRRNGWMRPGIRGVTYKKADSNKRMGPKGDVPIGRSSKSKEPKTDAGTPRCPRGFRRVGGECKPK